MQNGDEQRRIVIVGAGGRLGAALVRAYSRHDAVVGFNHAQLDLAHDAGLHEKLAAQEFDLLVNCAAQTNVDRCETEREEAFRLNGDAPGVLAKICSAKGARLVHISTDYVFDGEQTEPYTEEDEARPISVYGASKLAGEEAVLGVSFEHLVVRVSWVFGPDRPSFIDWAIGHAREHEHVEAIADKFSTPSYTLDLATMLRRLFTNAAARGIVHLTNGGACSWREYAQWAIDRCWELGIPMKAREVAAIALRDMKNFVARRPVHTVLATRRYTALTGDEPRHWRDAVAEFVRHKFGSR